MIAKNLMRGSSLPTWRLHQFILISAILFAAAFVGIFLPMSTLSGGVWAVLFLGFAVVFIFVKELRKPERSYFEPIFISLFVLFGMYVTRPLALFLGDRPAFFKGYRMDPFYAEAFGLAVLGIAGYLLGYFWPWRFLRRQHAQPPIALNTARILLLSLVFAGIGILLFTMYLRQIGGLGAIHSVLGGRDYNLDATYGRSSAYFYGALQMLFPCGVSLFLVYLITRQNLILIIAAAIQAPQLVLAAAQGSRITMLPIAFAYMACYYLFRRRNPPTVLMLVALYVVITVGLGFFVQVRQAGSDARRAWTQVLVNTAASPIEQVKNVFWAGHSNDMFDSLAIELNVVPQKLPINPFDFTYRTVAKVVPSLVWRGKPKAPEELIARVMFPDELSRASSSPGLIGNAFQFGGPFGVSFFFFIMGSLARRVWHAYEASPADPRAIGLVALSLGFIPIAFRGAVGDTLARMLFILVPFVIIWRLSTVELESAQSDDASGSEKVGSRERGVITPRPGLVPAPAFRSSSGLRVTVSTGGSRVK